MRPFIYLQWSKKGYLIKKCCDLQVKRRKVRCSLASTLKGPSSSIQALPTLEVGGTSKQKNPAIANIEISNESKEEEEDLISFDDIIDACDRTVDALEHLRLNQNIELVTQKHKQ